MKEIWNRKLSSFDSEIARVSDATGESFQPSNEQKEQTLKEFLKTDKARFRAFLSVIKKLEERSLSSGEENADTASPIQESKTPGTEEEGALEEEFSKELKILRILDSVDLFIKQYEQGDHATLEPRQLESLVRIATFLRSGKRRGYLELPTGLGKTVIFAELIEALKDVPGLRILVVGSGNINTIQNVQKVERFGGGEVGQYFAGRKELHAKITACNYNGLRNAIERGDFKGGDFDIVLLDEVHDGLGEVTQESIKRTFQKETVIGFSATATYELSKGRSASDFLPVEIDKMGVVEAVRGNLLAAFKVEVIKVPVVIKGVHVTAGDYLPNELERRINTKERNDLVVDSYLRFYRKAESKTIAFCVGRQHTQDLASAFEAKGIKAGILTGLLGIDEREAVLKKWKDGDIEVLCGSKLSWQALDETEATVGLNVAPSVSEKDVIQRGGRLLRRSQKRNNKKATLVEFLDEWRETKHHPLFYSEILETAEAEPDNWQKDVEEKPTVEIQETTGTPRKRGSLEAPKADTDAVKEPEVAIIPSDKIVRCSDAREVMAISNQNRKFRNEKYFEYAPKGWMSVNIIAIELGTTKKEVELAIYEVAKELSGNQFKKNSGLYLSSLGIKRIFYGGILLDKIYTYLVGATRAERIKSGTIHEVQDFDKLEKDSASMEDLKTEGKPDLEWRDYDLLPSFTLEGDSLEDEEQGINISDTSELHKEGEPIEGKFSDLVGYRYLKIGGRVFNSKISQSRIKQERKFASTKRYGVNLKGDVPAFNSDFRSEIEEREAEEIMMKIISSPDILDDREKAVISMLFLNNSDGKNTSEVIGKRFGITRSGVAHIEKIALEKIRRAVEVHELSGRITSKL